MAAAADLAGVYPLLCGKPYAAWSFGPSVDSPTMPTTCPIESSEVGVVNKLPQVTTEAGEVFAPALLLGPRAGKPGLIQGAFTGLDLSQMKLPCLATRIDYSAESGWALLKVQIIAHDVELDQTAELFVTDMPLPHQTPVDLVIPLVGSLAEGKVDVALVVHREGQEGTEIPALLWDNPRILDAGP